MLHRHLAAGRIVPAVSTTYALSEAGTALVDLAAGRITGKAVIAIAGSTS
ncbi:MAG: zinc-binding dehydrogenase [Ilumatobacteraceae bacterium]